MSNVSGSGHIVKVDRTVEMALYDGLPQRWRAMLSTFPVIQAMGPIYDYRKHYGDDKAYDIVVKIFQKKFPNWKPPVPGEDVIIEPSSLEKRMQRRSRAYRLRQTYAGRR